MKKTLIVVGYGNMAKAILANNSFVTQRYHLIITGRYAHKAYDFITQCALDASVYEAKVESSSSNKSIIDIEGKDILLCTKPAGLESFVFKGQANSVYSVLAGTSIAMIQKHLSASSIVRLMPNIAAHSKLSATAFYYHMLDTKDSAQVLHNEIRPFIESFGVAVQVDSEALIESSIAASGSSMAFLALIAESLIDAGILEGLNEQQSIALVKQTFVGFATELAHKSPNELKYAISSPGGTTIRGLAVLEESGMRGILIKAAHTAAEHARQAIQKYSTQDMPKKR